MQTLIRLPEFVAQADLDLMRLDIAVRSLAELVRGIPAEHVAAVDVPVFVANVQLEILADVVGYASHERVGESPAVPSAMARSADRIVARAKRSAVDAVGGVV